MIALIAPALIGHLPCKPSQIKDAFKRIGFAETYEVAQGADITAKTEAKDFLLQLQEQVAGEVIDHVYEIINTYQGKGNRWYDNDPMMLKGVELLRNAPASIQRVAALKLLMALEQKSFEGVEI